MALAAILAGVLTTIALARETATGRFLHDALVEIPAAALDRCARGQAVLVLLLILFAVAAVWAGEADGLRMFGMAAPDVAAWLTTFEIATYIDAAAALVAASASRHIDFGRRRSMSDQRPLPNAACRYVRPRCSRRRVHAAPANDDGDGTGLALTG